MQKNLLLFTLLLSFNLNIFSVRSGFKKEVKTSCQDKNTGEIINSFSDCYDLLSRVDVFNENKNISKHTFCLTVKEIEYKFFFYAINSESLNSKIKIIFSICEKMFQNKNKEISVKLSLLKEKIASKGVEIKIVNDCDCGFYKEEWSENTIFIKTTPRINSNA